jgi:hypothetical protein
MKRLLFLLLLIVPFAGKSQQYLIDPDTKKLTYSKVVEVPGMDREDLYARVRKWSYQQYSNTTDVTLSEAPEGGHIFVAASFNLSTISGEGKVGVKLTLYVKDGKYRYIITDFTFKGIESPLIRSESPTIPFENPIVGSRIRLLAQTDEQIQKIIADLNQSMVRRVFVSIDEW